MRILSLQVDNILRAVAVYIRPDGRVVELTGKNKQGKSSILEALWIAFGGEKSIPRVPIHDGAEAGSVIVEIGDDAGIKYKVTRKLKLKEDGSYSTALTVESADGAKFQRPQDILNGLVGAFSSDPLRLAELNDKDLFEEFKKFVPGVDFEAFEQAQAKDFAARTEINRRAKQLRARADGIVLPEKVPAEPMDESALLQAMQDAGEHNAEIDRERARRADSARSIREQNNAAEQRRRQIADLEDQIADLRAQAANYQSTADQWQVEYDALPELAEYIDVSAIRAEIDAAKGVNQIVAQAKNRNGIIAEAESAEKESADLTSAMKAREEQKIAAVAAAKMPVEGITFGDKVVLLNGFPLSQASGAERLRVAVAIQAAMNPKLRFVRIKSADALDDESWVMLEKMAEEMDFQVFCETVQSTRPTAVVIEDGHVKQPMLQAAE